MKKVKIMYWASTALIALLMCLSAYVYLTSQQIKDGFVLMGFPSYFRVELAVAKLLGALVLLLPTLPARAKEWAYAGFAITFVSALIAHIHIGIAPFMPLLMLGLLAVSYVGFIKTNQPKMAY